MHENANAHRIIDVCWVKSAVCSIFTPFLGDAHSLATAIAYTRTSHDRVRSEFHTYLCVQREIMIHKCAAIICTHRTLQIAHVQCTYTVEWSVDGDGQASTYHNLHGN